MNKLPLRNWGKTTGQAKAFGKLGLKSAKTSKATAKKVYEKSKQKISNLKDKLPKKSIYNKYGYF